MKILVEVKGKAKNGDVLVYDAEGQCFRAVSMQTFCHDLYLLMDKVNARVDNASSAIGTLNDQVNKIANVMKGD